MRISDIFPVVALALTCLSISACNEQHSEPEAEHHQIVATTPGVKDVTITQQYVCQIHSRRHIEICALESGYLQEVHFNEGQTVKKGDLLFKIMPTIYKAKLDAELAEAKLAELELNNTNRLMKDNVVSANEVALYQAKLAKAKAEAELAQAELNFTNVVAPFDGIVDRQHRQLGSLVEEGDDLTTLSDNSVMWVYFNVPEARYFEFMARRGGAKLAAQFAAGRVDDLKDRGAGNDRQENNQEGDQDGGPGKLDVNHVALVGHDEKADDHAAADDDDNDNDEHGDEYRDDDADRQAEGASESDELEHIELVLANGNKFEHIGTIGAIEADFNNETGNISFRADFPNPDGLLRNGQTGNVLIHRNLKDAIVIPQRATFEILDKRFVYVVGKDDVVRQREIVVENELEDIFVVKSGLTASDKIVLEGVRQVHDGEKVEYKVLKPEKALSNLKHHAE